MSKLKTTNQSSQDAIDALSSFLEKRFEQLKKEKNLCKRVIDITAHEFLKTNNPKLYIRKTADDFYEEHRDTQIDWQTGERFKY